MCYLPLILSLSQQACRGKLAAWEDRIRKRMRWGRRNGAARYSFQNRGTERATTSPLPLRERDRVRGVALLLVSVLVFCADGALPPQAYAQASMQPTRSPRVVLGRKHPGKVTGFLEEGVTVDLKDGGTQIVQFGEIWRIRRAFVSGEPAGTTVVDFADNRLFVAMPVASLIGDVGKKVPLAQFTAPNGEIVYMAAGKVTDIAAALPGLHNPASKTVIGTRDGTQQITEPADAAKRIVAEAHTAP